MKSEKSFEVLQQELQQVMTQLQDTADIDAALKLYEQGMELTVQIQAYLESAQNKIEKLNKKFDIS